MEKLSNLPNIGKTLANKLVKSGITNSEELKQLGSENTLLKIATIENSGVCINMLFALEGAIQGIRWHGISLDRKQELKEFFKLMQKKL